MVLTRRRVEIENELRDWVSSRRFQDVVAQLANYPHNIGLTSIRKSVFEILKAMILDASLANQVILE
jgi:hypothetical protein